MYLYQLYIHICHHQYIYIFLKVYSGCIVQLNLIDCCFFFIFKSVYAQAIEQLLIK